MLRVLGSTAPLRRAAALVWRNTATAPTAKACTSFGVMRACGGALATHSFGDYRSFSSKPSKTEKPPTLTLEHTLTPGTVMEVRRFLARAHPNDIVSFINKLPGELHWLLDDDEGILSRDEKDLLRGQRAAEVEYTREVDEFGRSYGTGRRKSSVARVWLKEGTGEITVNGKGFLDYFPRSEHRCQIVEPFLVTGMLGRFDLVCTVKGGGSSGQAGALRLGVSRALQAFEPSHRPELKRALMLRRDPRSVERKKPGQKKARKKFQWVKR